MRIYKSSYIILAGFNLFILMAITIANPNISHDAFHQTHGNVTNNKSETKTQELEDIQIQRTRDHPEIKSINDKRTFKEKFEPVAKFVFNDLIKYTTVSSVLVNLVSAPLRLLNENNTFKKIINNISMSLTRLHLASYAVSGMKVAVDNQNPFFVFSYTLEALATLFGLDKLYVFKGIASGIDAMACIVSEKMLNQKVFSNYQEGWKKLSQGIWKTTVEVLKDPKKFFIKDGLHKGVLSGYLLSLGGLIGIRANDYMGSALRDVAGGVNEYAFTQNDSNPTMRRSGWYSLAGTILDLSSRLIFNNSIANLIPSKSDRDVFLRIRDALHELAIAGDRVGQYYFIKCNEANDEERGVVNHSNGNGNGDTIKANNKASLAKVLAQAPRAGAQYATVL